MTAQQLPFDFAYRAASSAGDFIISEPNGEAVAWIDRYPAWPGAGLLLIGQSGNGKTHLARVWQQKSGAVYVNNAKALADVLADEAPQNVIIDDAQNYARAAQEGLFHLFNRALLNKTHLLICATDIPQTWGLTLPDLASRLETLPVARLGDPDDMLLAALFVKHMTQRGITIKPEVMEYIFLRLPRSAAAVADVAAALDRYALEAGKGISLALARQFFNAHGETAPKG